MRGLAIQSVSNDLRRGRLRNLIKNKNCIRIMEAHNPISALIVENTKTFGHGHSEIQEFDGFWSSSLIDSTVRGMPDIEVLDIKTRLANISDIFSVTTKPLIMDGDTGGHVEHFVSHIREMERAGISATVIEDKTGLKRNSLFGTDVPQTSISVEEFSDKIKKGKSGQRTQDFMIIARIESLILGLGMKDALNRADAYINAGADGIMIHSRKPSPDEIMEFAAKFRLSHKTIPLVCVPTSYSSTHSASLEAAGFNVIIYANHMLRAAYKAMQAVSQDILQNGRTTEVEDRCMSVSEILHLVPNPCAQIPAIPSTITTIREAG